MQRSKSWSPSWACTRRQQLWGWNFLTIKKCEMRWNKRLVSGFCSLLKQPTLKLPTGTGIQIKQLYFMQRVKSENVLRHLPHLIPSILSFSPHPPNFHRFCATVAGAEKCLFRDPSVCPSFTATQFEFHVHCVLWFRPLAARTLRYNFFMDIRQVNFLFVPINVVPGYYVVHVFR